MFSLAFRHGLAQTDDWLRARAAELSALPRTPAGASFALDYLVGEWTRQARPLALLYQECRATPSDGVGDDWTRLWRDFWLRTAGEFGLGETDGRLLHAFFESEALYNLSTWSPALERAALRELCDHFGSGWLGAPRTAAAGALALAERAATAQPGSPETPAAARIAEAAAKVVETVGLGGLTHRAVAARAGVTTGAVTHHFRTIEDLVAGAIRGQVLAIAQEAPDGPAPLPLADTIDTPDGFFEAVRRYAVADRPAGPILRRRNLFLAAVRRPEQASAAAVIRFAYGGTVRQMLVRSFGLPASDVALDAAVISRLLASIWLACSADLSPRSTRAALVARIAGRLEYPS
ncbi:MAG: TetR family transcriptional regulator [Caulobacteraceae bacterium]|nr:TetR family transcriptional regulator [Caulobacteraceae bacterium]